MLGPISFVCFSIPTFLILNDNNLVIVFLGIMSLAITHTNVRRKFLSVKYKTGTAVFGGITPLILSSLGNLKNRILAPAIYLIIINLIGLIVFNLYFVPTSSKPLKASNPNIEIK